MTDANRPNDPHLEPSQFGDRESLTPEQARLREALMRSRAIPLDGPIPTEDEQPAPMSGSTRADVEEDAVRHDPAQADANATSAVPLPPHPTTAANDDGGAEATEPAEAEQFVPVQDVATDDELRSEADYERALREEPAPVAAPVPAPAREVDPEELQKDADTFAPLGISNADSDFRRPEKRSNRGFALLMSVIATMLFGLAYAAIFSIARVIYAPGSELLPTALAFIGTAPFYVAVAVCFVGMLLWSVITNRGSWVSFVVAGLVIGLATFFAYHLGVAVQQLVNTGSWDIAPMLQSLRAPEHLPGALIAFFTARELITWLGGLIALRGRKLTRLMAAESEEYERRRAANAA